MNPYQQTMYLSSYVPAETEHSWAVAPYQYKKRWVPMPQLAGLGLSPTAGVGLFLVAGLGLLALLSIGSKKPARRR